jgi:hypothetical protein
MPALSTATFVSHVLVRRCLSTLLSVNSSRRTGSIPNTKLICPLHPGESLRFHTCTLFRSRTSLKPSAKTGCRWFTLFGPPACWTASRHLSSFTPGGLIRAAGSSTTFKNRCWKRQRWFPGWARKASRSASSSLMADKSAAGCGGSPDIGSGHECEYPQHCSICRAYGSINPHSH